MRSSTVYVFQSSRICERPFRVCKSRLLRRGGKFCSRRCYYQHGMLFRRALRQRSTCEPLSNRLTHQDALNRDFWRTANPIRAGRQPHVPWPVSPGVEAPKTLGDQNRRRRTLGKLIQTPTLAPIRKEGRRAVRMDGLFPRVRFRCSPVPVGSCLVGSPMGSPAFVTGASSDSPRSIEPLLM